MGCCLKTILVFGALDITWEVAKMLEFLNHMFAVTVKGSEEISACVSVSLLDI